MAKLKFWVFPHDELTMGRSIQSASTLTTIAIGGGENKNAVDVQIKETVKDCVFPVAKFSHKEDSPQKGKNTKALGARRW